MTLGVACVRFVMVDNQRTTRSYGEYRKRTISSAFYWRCGKEGSGVKLETYKGFGLMIPLG